MKKFTNVYSMFVGKAVPSKVRFALFLLAIVLFVLGSGAPEAGGGIISRGPLFGF